MWVNELKRQGSPEMVIALVGNKIDLMDREVFDAEVSAYAEEEKFVDIVTETSAKTGVGVREVFVDIANVFANKIREVYLYLIISSEIHIIIRLDQNGCSYSFFRILRMAQRPQPMNLGSFWMKMISGQIRKSQNAADEMVW